MRILWTGLTAISLLLAATARGADLKIGVVDMSRLVQAHPDTADADELLEKQAEEFETEKKELLEKFGSMRDDFEKARSEASNKALSESAREQKRDEAREKLIALEEFQQSVRETTLRRQQQLADQGDRMRRRIVGKIVGIIEGYANDNGYKLILDTANRGLSGVESVIYADKALDITEAVLKIIAAPQDQE
jgi:Skp family chaperone for outer membrane proteins